jgi:bacteriorhodopsin
MLNDMEDTIFMDVTKVTVLIGIVTWISQLTVSDQFKIIFYSISTVYVLYKLVRDVRNDRKKNKQQNEQLTKKN